MKKTYLLLITGLLFFAPLQADDTAIFGGATEPLEVRPNVLIVIDTSTSMSWNFATTYDPTYDYTVDVALWNAAYPTNTVTVYNRDTVYLRGKLRHPSDWDGQNTYNWSAYAASVAGVLCLEAHDDLNTEGHWWGFVNVKPNDNTTNAPCGIGWQSYRYLATGNYLAFLNLQSQSKLAYAKVIIDDILAANLDPAIEGNPTMEVGIMIFNEEMPYDPDEAYDPAIELNPEIDHNYNDYNMEDVYKTLFNSFTGFTVDQILCEEAFDDLKEFGIWDGRLKADLSCGTSGLSSTYRTLNWLHYDLWPDIDRDGGKIIAPIGADYATIHNILAVDESIVTPSGSTPLAETLAEAGLYFHGTKEQYQKSWANADCYYPEPENYVQSRKNVDYWPSPTEQAIGYRCQKNFIILLTDGVPSSSIILGSDNDGERYGKSIYGGDYIYPPFPNVKNNQEIPYNVLWTEDDPDWKDGLSLPHTFTIQPNKTLLDEIAAWLYNNDLITGVNDLAGVSFDRAPFDKQNVRTYTVGLEAYVHYDPQLLADTARAGHGRFYPVNSGRELRSVFDDILSDIFTISTGFAATSVPQSGHSKFYSGDSVYMPIFQPVFGGKWIGNIKKYALYSDASLHDQRKQLAAHPDGILYPTAIDLWDKQPYNASNDYTSPDIGGVGQWYLTGANNTNRTFYTTSALTGGGRIIFNSTNISAADLDIVDEVNDGKVTVDEVINTVKAVGETEWVLGDIIHSTPATMKNPDNDNQTIIFVGANDGFLHAYVDDNGGTPTYAIDDLTHIAHTTGGPFTMNGQSVTIDVTDDTVSEAWSFTPRDLLPDLKRLHQAFRAEEDPHSFYVDARPILYEKDDHTYLVFGRRRGGQAYTILDVTSYSNPLHIRTIMDEGSTFLTGEPLGQSWSTPKLGKIKLDTTTTADVILLTGGYDTNQDSETPATSDSKGRAVFAINSTSGAKLWEISHNDFSEMTHSIVDLAVFDKNFDNIYDTVYAPDMAGNLFAFRDVDGDGNWQKQKIFSVRRAGLTSDWPLKFFYAPDITVDPGDEFVFIGTGDRAHPMDYSGNDPDNIPTKDQNRFYAIKHNWSRWNDETSLPIRESASTDPLATDGLVDITDTSYDGVVATQIRDSALGWFFRLEDPAEKIVSQPITLGGVVFFTTYTPPVTLAELQEGETGWDMCSAARNLGYGRLYAINYKTGQGVYDRFLEDSDLQYDSNPVKDKRSFLLGASLPPQPALISTREKVNIIVGSFQQELDVPPTVIRYYWHTQGN